MVVGDDTFPRISRTSLWKVLKLLGFKYEKKGRHNLLYVETVEYSEGNSSGTKHILRGPDMD